MNRTFLTLCVGAGLIFNCCSPDALDEEISELSSTSLIEGKVSIADGRLKVVSLTDWEWLTSHDQEETQIQLLSELGSKRDFTSLLAVVEDAEVAKSYISKGGRVLDTDGLLVDEFFYSLLTPEGLIELGPYLVKVNLKQEEVFVLRSEDIAGHKASLLNEDTTDPAVIYFTFEDDVVDNLMSGNLESSNRTEWCNGDNTRQIEVDKFYRYGSSTLYNSCATQICMRYRAYHGYFKGGIYFSLKSRGEHHEMNQGIAIRKNAYIRITSNWNYTIKCASQGNGDMTFNNSGQSYNLVVTAYSGINKLSYYRMNTDYYFFNNVNTGGVNVIWSGSLLGI